MGRSYSVSLINRTTPKDWRDLQKQVNQIFQECGFESEPEQEIQTVRGTVRVDVLAKDPSSKPVAIYLCECKHWQSNVPQTVVHAFRTVVADYGANWGYIISSTGFQSGALEAARNSNVRLLTWDEFQELFIDRWIENYMMPRLREVDPLVEYTEPINSRIFGKAEKLDEPSKQRFAKLREEYQALAFLAILFPFGGPFLKSKRPDLPLRKAIQGVETGLPEEVLDASCLRDFVDAICKHASQGIATFDELFGGRA